MNVQKFAANKNLITATYAVNNSYIYRKRNHYGSLYTSR